MSEKRVPAPPIEYRPWPDGINPNAEPERKAEIIENRKKRARQLEDWQPGAGRAYYESLNIPKIGG